MLSSSREVKTGTPEAFPQANQCASDALIVRLRVLTSVSQLSQPILRFALLVQNCYSQLWSEETGFYA